MSFSEFADTLTGFDEIAIETHMGFSVYDAEKASQGIKSLRALVFVAKLRDGLNAPDAKKAALEMTAGVLNEFFADEPEDVIEDEPDSDAGKGGSAPESALTTSPPSA